MRSESSSAGRAFRKTAVIAASLIVGQGAFEALETQEPPDFSIDEVTQVRSIEVLVGSDKGGKLRAWATGKQTSGPELRAGEIDIQIGGRTARVTVAKRTERLVEPRRIVLFFDAPTSSQTSFRLAATRLAGRAQELVDYGEIEVVLASPEPRLMLGPTRDAAVLEALLSNTSLFAELDDVEITALRDEFLELSASVEADDLDRLARHFAAMESRVVVRRQDALLGYLGNFADDVEPVRLLIYVSQGFDKSPTRFYLADAADHEDPLAAETEAWLQSLAGYGWTCLPLVYEDRRALLRRGVRIGKWRFQWTARSDSEELRLRSDREPFGAVRETDRDPQRADTWAELADTELEAGDFEAAAEDFSKAIHHYYNDPRTQERQAAAWYGLSLALRAENDRDAARSALANALELDPTLAQKEGIDVGFTGASVLSDMARESGGWVLTSDRDISMALDEIGRRQILGFDLPEAPSGSVLPLVITALEGKGKLRHVRWVRSGTPARMAAARLRNYLTEQQDEPASAAQLEVLVTGTGDEARTVLVEDVPSHVDRVIVALETRNGDRQVVELAAAAPSKSGRPGSAKGALSTWSQALESDSSPVTAAVYFETVATAEWRLEPAYVSRGHSTVSSGDAEDPLLRP